MARCVYMLTIVALSLLLAGCTARATTTREAPTGRIVHHMHERAADRPIGAPEVGKAMVVFLRPSTESGTASPVYELRSGEDTFIGFVPPRSKLTYVTRSGKTRFMVVSEAADFMEAELEAGKTYYTLVTERRGYWKPGFSLSPVKAAAFETAEVTDCLNKCRLVENSDASHAWAKRNLPSIQKRKANSLGEWEARTDRPSLGISDGR